MSELPEEPPARRDLTLAWVLAALGCLAIGLSIISLIGDGTIGDVLPSLGIGAGVACNGISTLLSGRIPGVARYIFYLQYPFLAVGVVAAFVYLLSLALLSTNAALPLRRAHSFVILRRSRRISPFRLRTARFFTLFRMTGGKHSLKVLGKLSKSSQDQQSTILVLDLRML